MKQTFYPEATQASQLQEVLRLLITRGSLTHTECEEATVGRPSGKITTIRSAVADLRLDMGWGSYLVTTMESHGNGRHARYSIDFMAIGVDMGLSADLLKEVALNAISKGKVFCSIWQFRDLIEVTRLADLRLRHALYHHQSKINPDQLGLGLTI